MVVSAEFEHTAHHRPSAWLPSEHKAHRGFVKRIAVTVDELELTSPSASSCSDEEEYQHIEYASHKAGLTPALQELEQLIENDVKLFMLFTQMFSEIPNTPPYWCDPTGQKQIRDYKHLLAVLNYIVQPPPEWNDAAESVGLLGVPMCAILNGHAVFLDPDVNRALKRVLNEWGQHLKTSDSTCVLNNSISGWLGQTALKNIVDAANAPYKTSMRFEDMYVCDNLQEKYGFKSWDDFFTRRIREHARPVASPSDDRIVANACESRVFNIAYNVKLRDCFFAKGQPYSVIDMLGQDPLATQFAGGTVYQVFLSAVSYHRWHSPVSGIVRRAFIHDGTYFSVPLFAGLGVRGVADICDDGLGMLQAYISAMATRAIIIIEADNVDIGLVAS